LVSLEDVVHVPPSLRVAGELPARTAVQIEVPEGAEVHDLPDDVGDLSDIVRTRAFGDNRVRDRRARALRVPSLVLRSEWNLRVNPEHPDMTRVRVLRAAPFVFDHLLAPGRPLAR
jgi:RES domain-containing protein